MKKTTTLITQCATALEKAILEGEFLPGKHLRNEELKQIMHMTLSPIREALAKLAERGLLSFEENKGYSVVKRTKTELLDALSAYAEIECLCLRHAIENGDDDWESQIVAALHKLKKIENQDAATYSSWAPVNAEFHRSLIAACPNNALLKIRERSLRDHEWYVCLSYKFADEQTLKMNHLEHQSIAEVILKRNAEEGMKALYHHITAGKEKLVNNLLKNNLITDN